MIDGMATHDTDPKNDTIVSPPDEDRTTMDPASPDEDGSSAFAESLLADLAKAPLPAQDVRETEGHAAAAYAVPPHRPPRANEKTIENAAVVVNTTQPLPDAEPTVRGGALLVSTTPSARAQQQQRRVLYASLGGAVAAAMIALVAVLLVRPRAEAAAPATASAAPSTPSAVAVPSVATAPATASAAPDPPARTTSARATSSASKPPAKASPRPSSTRPASTKPHGPRPPHEDPDTVL